MRARRVLPLLAIASAAGAMTEEFSEFRLGLGAVTGFDKERISRSQTAAGVDDPSNNTERKLDGKLGFDAQPGLWMGSTIGDGLSIVFGGVAVVRTPGATYSDSRDTGTPNGAGTGNVQRHDSGRIRTVLFGGKLAGGLGWMVGPTRLEVTPFVGVGAISARIQESQKFTNNPNALAQFVDWDSSFSNRGTYFEYGVSGNLSAQVGESLVLGASAGWQAIRGVVHVDTHGPGTDSADYTLMMRTGAFVDGVVALSF